MPTTPGISPRRAATRKKVLEAATELFAQQGVTGVSVEAITTAAGFTRGAFYSNFDSKDDLIEGILNDLEQGVVSALKRLETTPTSSVEEVVDAFYSVQPTTISHYLILEELALHGARNPEESSYRKFLEKIESRISEQLILKLKQAGYRSNLSEEDLVYALSGFIDRIYRKASLQGTDEALPTDVRERVAAFLTAVTTRIETP